MNHFENIIQNAVNQIEDEIYNEFMSAIINIRYVDDVDLEIKLVVDYDEDGVGLYLTANIDVKVINRDYHEDYVKDAIYDAINEIIRGSDLTDTDINVSTWGCDS